MINSFPPPLPPDCRRFRSLLPDAEVAQDEALFMTAHANGCLPCRQERETLDRLANLLRGVPAVSAPDGLADRIMAQIESEPVVVVGISRFGGKKKLLPIAAAVTLLVLGVSFLARIAAPPSLTETASRSARGFQQAVNRPAGAKPVADTSELAVVPQGEVYHDPVSTLVGF